MKYLIPIITALTVALGITTVSGATLPIMRISVENSESHVQTMAVNRFATLVKEKLAGQVDIRFFSNARLFRDRDIIQALGQGKVEMAVPGTWHVTQFQPDVGIFLLPLFYGTPARANYAVLDGTIGVHINEGIEKNLQVKVLGRWIDLGHAHLFGIHRKINHHEDIKGLRVRVAGGLANKLRIQALGGVPTIIPWPDLPEYMQQDRVDAILTSYETIRSGQLWKNGVLCAFEDREYFPQYIPLIRASFWHKLTPVIQQVLMDTWEAHVEDSRQLAAKAQTRAKETLVQNGVKIVVPDIRELEKRRDQLLLLQDAFVKELDIDPELVSHMERGFTDHE